MSKERSWGAELAVLLVGLFFAFVNVTLLVPVLPAVAGGLAGSNGAGLATGCFYFPAVAMQLPTSLIMQRFPARWVMGVSLSLLGIPCFAYAAAPHNLAVLLGASVVRGAGFGIGTVAVGTLVAQLAPAARRGTAIGYAGLVAGIPPVFAPSLGVALLHQLGAGAVFLLAGGAGLVGGSSALMLRTRPPHASERRSRLIRSTLDRRLLWPLGWFSLVSLTRGAVLSFVPLTLLRGGLASASAFLLVFGTLAFVGRWVCGRIADRVGPRPLIVPGILSAVTGLALLAASDTAGPVVAAAACYGLGCGWLMTASQLDMLSRAVGTAFSVPTAVWNISIDLGAGLGGVLFGLVVWVGGYGTAFWLLPGVMVVGLAVALLEPTPLRTRTTQPAPP